MSSPRVLSVNVGRPVTATWAGSKRRTSFRKHSVDGPVRVHELGLEGDQVADTKHHGGVFQAVYAFAQEDLDLWAQRIGGPLGPAMFGENLTTGGLDVNEAVLGEHWRIGTALLSPVEVRIPCSVFKNWLGRHLLDNAEWAKRFTAEGRPGPYLRVLEEGVLQAGDEIVVEHRPEHGFTVSMMFRALTTDPSLLPGLLDVPGLPEPVYAVARRRTAPQTV
ncbi:MOSC domain-containing protein [Nocardioides panacis]|uniref:MOSC domain-containing protein n=1 Tax=Nocardioides panacis TaxID=2849501 RepID=A0A975XYT0_9ACTN|nr:MOSC domain-containing protein [Nocardioides panacis]QWZ06529.1 MOSC domain-containing protein [Nocardioides panacis]